MRMELLFAAGIASAALTGAQGNPPANQASPPPQASSPTQEDGVVDDVGISQDKRARMTVPISIDGKGPYEFLIDTGAERTVISSELAQHLALEEGKPARMHSMSGVGEVGTVIIPKLQVSKKSISGINAPALKQANLGASGMLGIDSLASQRIVLDFGRKKMSVVPSRASETAASPDEIVVRAKSRFGRLVLVDATLEGQKLMVVLDTGSEVTVGNAALRRKLETKQRLRKTVPIELISVTGGKIAADYTSVKEVKLGGVLIHDLPVAFADVHPFRQLDLIDRPALLLGMDALRLFDRVSVDFASRRVRFLSPDLSGSAVPVRMAGLPRAAS